jgi:rhodanese-related sulfurtransferase/DNA-binding HxlR family transcriptional regulator
LIKEAQINPFQSRLHEAQAHLLKALGSPARLALLSALLQAPRSVEALAQACELSLANASQHLQHLYRAGLVQRQKQGLQVLYSLATPAIASLLGQLQALALAQLSEVRELDQQFMATHGQWEAVSLQDLSEKLAAGAVLIDVRPAEEYAAGHLPEARSLPLPELTARLKDLRQTLPTDRPLIAYCRDAYCVFAPEAAAMLSAAGFKVLHLRGGVAEWQAQQRPLVTNGYCA